MVLPKGGSIKKFFLTKLGLNLSLELGICEKHNI